MTIVNDDSSSVSKWGSKLIDDTRVVIYNCNIIIIQATCHTGCELSQGGLLMQLMVLRLNVSCGLHYKQFTIINYDPSIINKFGASLTDDARVIIYNCHMLIVQATDLCRMKD